MKILKAKNQIKIDAEAKEEHYWREVAAFKELFLILALRDISVRYKQATLGVLWAVIRPLITMIILVVVFSKIAKLSSINSMPYSIFVFIAIIPWYFFSSAVSDASHSLINNTNLITKVFFPRVIIPVSAIMVSIVDVALSLMMLFILCVLNKYTPTWKIIFLPFCLILLLLLTIGTSLLLCTLTAKYLDFRYVIPFLTQLSLYISPIGYDTSLVSSPWTNVYYLNPLVGIIDACRWCISQQPVPFNLESLSFSLTVTMLVFISGIIYFRAHEKTLADTI